MSICARWCKLVQASPKWCKHWCQHWLHLVQGNCRRALCNPLLETSSQSRTSSSVGPLCQFLAFLNYSMYHDWTGCLNFLNAAFHTLLHCGLLIAWINCWQHEDALAVQPFFTKHPIIVMRNMVTLFHLFVHSEVFGSPFLLALRTCSSFSALGAT